MGDEPRPLEDLQDDTAPETDGIDAHGATIVSGQAYRLFLCSVICADVQQCPGLLCRATTVCPAMHVVP
jgi:hypothetical protein